MVSAAKERISSWSEGPLVALPLAAAVPVAKNSRQGFEPKKINSHPGWSEVSFKTVPGMGVRVRRNGIRSRCQFLNRYAYVMNNPTSLVDPSGMGAQSDDCAEHPGSAACGHDAVGSGTDRLCYMDGIGTPCSVVYNAVAASFAVVCPGGCETVNAQNQWVYYRASLEGAGYFTYSGPGSLFYSLQTAGTAAALMDQALSAADPVMREYGEPVYAEAGFYSYSPAQQGPPCDLATGACGPWGVDMTDIPDGATAIGIAHDHPGTGYGSYSFSEGCPYCDTDVLSAGGFYGFLATRPSGRVLMFNPTLWNTWTNGQPLPAGIKPPTCVIQGPLMGEAPC